MGNGLFLDSSIQASSSTGGHEAKQARAPKVDGKNTKLARKDKNYTYKLLSCLQQNLFIKNFLFFCTVNINGCNN